MARRDDYRIDPRDNPWEAVQDLLDHNVRHDEVDALLLADGQGLPVLTAGRHVDAVALSACCPYLASGTADGRILENLKGEQKYGLSSVETDDSDLFLMAVYPAGANPPINLETVAKGTSELLSERGDDLY